MVLGLRNKGLLPLGEAFWKKRLIGPQIPRGRHDKFDLEIKYF